MLFLLQTFTLLYFILLYFTFHISYFLIEPNYNITDTLKAASDLASVYASLSLWTQAKDLYEQTYELMDATLGPDHKETLMAQFYYAAICVKLNRPLDARVFIERVADMGPSVLVWIHIHANKYTYTNINYIHTYKLFVIFYDRICFWI